VSNDNPSKPCRTLPLLRLIGANLAAGLAAVAILISPVSGSANSDPHRSPLPAGPLDLPATYCGFPMHLDFPVNMEYQTISTASDGSTVLTITGSLFVTATNQVTGKAVTVNASGPGTLTISPNGATGIFDNRGLFFLFAPNAKQFGFPSNVVVTSGAWSFISDFNTNNIIGLTTAQPRVLSDICAALS